METLTAPFGRLRQYVISPEAKMLAPDQAQLMAALGVPTGPGMSMPGSVFQSPAASWMDPQWPLVSGGAQFGDNTALILKALGPQAPKNLGQGNFAPTRSGGSPV